MNSVRIDVLGSSFTVQTDEDPAYFAELLAFYRSRIDLVEAQTKIKDPARLSALAAILIADELFKLKDDPNSRSTRGPAFGSVLGAAPVSGGRDFEEAERIALRLIADIEEKLPED